MVGMKGRVVVSSILPRISFIFSLLLTSVDNRVCWVLPRSLLSIIVWDLPCGETNVEGFLFVY